jgi:hypothetical protein
MVGLKRNIDPEMGLWPPPIAKESPKISNVCHDGSSEISPSSRISNKGLKKSFL